MAGIITAMPMALPSGAGTDPGTGVAVKPSGTPAAAGAVLSDEDGVAVRDAVEADPVAAPNVWT